MRRIDYLFLAMIAFAAAVASAPPPHVPAYGEADRWLISEGDRQALQQLDLSGNPKSP